MYDYASALAGLGLFLSALHLLSASMKPLAGKKIKTIMSKLTGRYISSAFAGTFLGAITQSTSGATFICMGLVNSGAIPFKKALTVLAWSSVGGSLLVFLVSIDIRLTGLILVGLVGISHLFNVDRIEKIKYLVAILFAMGLLLLGLGMMKEGAHLIDKSYWVKEFIEFASETTTVSFIIGLMLTLVTQSAATITIIGITLVMTGIIPFSATVILIFGANIGSGLSLLLITSHLNGTQKQLSFYQFLVKLSGVLLIMPLFLMFSGLSQLNYEGGYEPIDIAYQVSIIYLLLQVSGALCVSLFQQRIIHTLTQLFPDNEEESLSQTKYIYPEAIENSDIAISLAKKEQDRLVSTLSNYLDPLRGQTGVSMSLMVRNESNIKLAHEIKYFIDDVSHHEIDGDISHLLEIQSRNDAIISLLSSLNEFTNTVSQTDNYHEGLSGSIIESLHLILTLMEETVSSDENNEFLMELTSDKSQLMDTIRDGLLSNTSESASKRKSIFVSTRVFEKVVWQIRQMLKSQTVID